VSLQTFPASPGPSKAEPETAVRVLEAQYGDGYTQTQADGLNSISDTYSVGWNLLTRAELNAFTDFLTAHAGYVPFLWTPPLSSAARQWKCKTWKPVPLGGGWYSLSCTFKESFDL
jgi:phage-related protein